MRGMDKKGADAAIGMFILLILGFFLILGFLHFYLGESGSFNSQLTRSNDVAIDNANTGLDIETIVSRPNNNEQIDTLVITMKPLIGSGPIKLDDMTVIIQQKNTTSILRYRNGTTTKDKENGFYTD